MKPMSANSLLCFIAILLAILCLTSTTSAAAGGRCEAYTGTICAPLYADGTTYVYVPSDDVTQQMLESSMRDRFGAFGSIQRNKCAAFVLASLCAQTLPTCYYDQNDVPQPRYPTQDFCPDTAAVTDANTVLNYDRKYVVPDACKEDENLSEKKNEYFFLRNLDHRDTVKHVYSNYTLRPRCYDIEKAYIEKDVPADCVRTEGPRCGGIYNRTHYELLQQAQVQADPRYLNFVNSFKEGYAEVYYPNSKADWSIELPTPPTGCPVLLTAVSPGDYSPTDSPCAIPCPNLTFTEKQYETEDVVIIVMNSLSIAALFTLLISWVVFPALRLQSYVFYYIICIGAMTLALFVLIPIATAQNKTIAASLCRNATEEYHMDGYAIFQAIVVCFCYLSATAWGLVMVVDIFIQVFVGKHYQKQSREHLIKERIYHVFAWACGVYSVVGGLASQQMGSLVSVGGAYALITQSRDQLNRGEFNAGNAFFYIPLIILTILSIIFMCLVLYKLIRFKTTAKTTGLKVATFVRLCLFIVANTFIIVVLLVYTVYITGKRDQLNELTNQFVQCLHLKATWPLTDVDCGEAPDHGLNFNILLLSVALFNGMGFIAFLIYGTTFDLLYSWLGLIYVLTGWTSLKKYEKDYKRNRKTTKQTSKTHSTTANKSQLSRSGTSGFTSTGFHHDSQTNPTSRHYNDTHNGSHTQGNTQGSHTAGGKEQSSHQKSSVFAYHNQHRKGTITHRNTTGGDSVEMSEM